MAKVMIGRVEYEIPELNFIALERAWPFVEEAMIAPDPMRGVSAGIHIIAAGLVEAEHFNPENFGIRHADLKPNLDVDDQVFFLVAKWLKRKTLATEIDGIRRAIVQITEEAGLEKVEGETFLAEEVVSLSPGTGVPISPNSSPLDVKAEVGTS